MGTSRFSRSVLSLVLACLAAACGPDAETGAAAASGASVIDPSAPAAVQSPVTPVIASATPYTAVDLAACLKIAAGDIQASESQCPGFINKSAVEPMATCKAMGGKLSATEEPSLQSLDVNGDGEPEFLYDFTANFGCDTAASVFSCGSLGCPVALVTLREGAWTVIGNLNSDHAEGVEVLAPEGEIAYSTLRGGCGGARPCDELWYYRWDGKTYQADTIEVRGHVVDFANDGLWTLVDDQPVLAEPSPDAAVLERHPKDTLVVVIGDARTTPYKFVSPCNACARGFVEAGVLRRSP